MEQAGQRLADFASLSADEFIAEVKKRRPRAAGALTPATLKALRTGYTEQAAPVQLRAGKALGLERWLAELVNAAYGLTPEDVDLLCAAHAANAAGQRAALTAELEQRAQWAENGEAEGSPYLALAARLRELATQLAEADDADVQP